MKLKGFIEVHATTGKKHLVNVRHITEVVGSTIYTDDTHPFLTDFSHVDCLESYEEIKRLIEEATS